MKWQLWAYQPTSSTPNKVTVLPMPASWDASMPVSDVGALNLTYPLTQPGIDVLYDYADIEIRYLDGATWKCPPNGRFCLSQINPDVIGEQQTPARKFTGQSYGWMLRGIIQSDYIDLNDDGSREFKNKTLAEAIGILIDEAQDAGAAPGLSWQIVSDSGAACNPISPGEDVASMLSNGASTGVLDWQMVPDDTGQCRRLAMYSKLGTDRSATVELVQGRDVMSTPATVSALDVRAAALVRGDDGKYLWLTNPGADVPYGLLQQSVSAAGATTLSQLQVTGQAALDKGRTWRSSATADVRFDDSRYLPFVDYGLGDKIMAPGPLRPGQVAQRVAQISITQDGARVSGSLTLGERFITGPEWFHKRLSQKAPKPYIPSTVYNGKGPAYPKVGDIVFSSQPIIPTLGVRLALPPCTTSIAAVGGLVYVLDTRGTTSGNDLYQYSPATGLWSSLAELPTPGGGSGSWIDWSPYPSPTDDRPAVWFDDHIYWPSNPMTRSGVDGTLEEVGDGLGFWLTVDSGNLYAVTVSSSNVASVYDPDTQTWTALRGGVTSGPTHGMSQAVVYDGKVWYVDGATSVLCSVSIDGTDNPFSVSAVPWPTPTGTGQSANSAMVVRDGKLWVIGGFYDGGVTDEVHIYDPTAGTWLTGVAIPHAAGELTAFVDADGVLYVSGGYDGSTNYEYLYRWETAGSWTSIALPAGAGYVETFGLVGGSMFAVTAEAGERAYRASTASVVHGQVLVSDGASLYACGGVAGTAYQAAARSYDPSGNSWSGTLGSASWTAAATAWGYAGVIGGKLYYGGGVGAAGLSAAVSCYDITAGTWSAVADGPAVSHAGSAVIDGKLYVVGGRDSSGYSPGLHVYDPIADTWTALASTLGAITDPAVCTSESKIFVLGAEQDLAGTYAPIPHVWIYDPTTDAWSTSQDLTVPHTAAGAVAIADYLFTAGGLTDGYHDHEAAIDAGTAGDDLYSDVLTVWMSPPSPISTFTDGGSGGGWAALAV